MHDDGTSHMIMSSKRCCPMHMHDDRMPHAIIRFNHDINACDLPLLFLSYVLDFQWHGGLRHDRDRRAACCGSAGLRCGVYWILGTIYPMQHEFVDVSSCLQPWSESNTASIHASIIQPPITILEVVMPFVIQSPIIKRGCMSHATIHPSSNHQSSYCQQPGGHICQSHTLYGCSEESHITVGLQYAFLAT